MLNLFGNVLSLARLPDSLLYHALIHCCTCIIVLGIQDTSRIDDWYTGKVHLSCLVDPL